MAGVLSVEPSSITINSNAAPSCASTLSIASATKASPLQTGMITLICGDGKLTTLIFGQSEQRAAAGDIQRAAPRLVPGLRGQLQSFRSCSISATDLIEFCKGKIKARWPLISRGNTPSCTAPLNSILGGRWNPVKTNAV